MPPRQTTTPGGGLSWRRLGLRAALLALLVAGIGALLVRGDMGLVQLRERSRQLERAQQEVARLQAETDQLRLVLWQLENDLEYVEKVAREEYGMSRPTELVLRLPSDPPARGQRD
jgi:cell division protein FtsB